MSDFTHHLQMAAVTGELSFEVSEVGGGGVQAIGQQPCHQPGNLWICADEGVAILDDVNFGVPQGPDRGRVWDAEQHRHFAHQRARFVDDGDWGAVTQYFDAAFREDVDMASRLAFGQQFGSARHILQRNVAAVLENLTHWSAPTVATK
jgi:hypothetical protein